MDGSLRKGYVSKFLQYICSDIVVRMVRARVNVAAREDKLGKELSLIIVIILCRVHRSSLLCINASIVKRPSPVS